MRHSPPAYSLLFAFLVMTMILIIATTTVQNTNEKMVYFREMEGSTQAKLAAESATEQAILAMKDFNAGYSIDLTEEVFQADNNDDGTYETWGNYTVYSSAEVNDSDGGTGYFYTPIPGTGTAGDPDDCSILNEDEDVDHPCNWNKLMYGQSVTIPLYTDDGSGGILTPADFSSFTGWYLKVRTPCEDGSDDPDCVRFEFDGDGTDVITDPDDDDSSVVFWQLVGEDADGNSVSLLPDDTDYTAGLNDKRDTDYNTEIYESLINTAGDFIVLSAIDTTPYAELYSVCTEIDLSTLSLQLNIVTPLVDLGGVSIPYLEWQLATEASQGFGDTKTVITGEGYYESQNKIFYYPFVVTRPTTGESTNVYTLSN
jgi:hypothetical protein